MIYTIPTSQPVSAGSGSGGKKKCSCASTQQTSGPMVLNGQTTGPIMPMGNNLFQVPTRRRTTTTTSKGKNLFQGSSSSTTTSRGRSSQRSSHRRGLSGLGQDDDSLDVLPVDTSDLSAVASLPAESSYSDLSTDTDFDTTLNPFLSPALDTGALTTEDVSSVISPSDVSSYAAATGMSTTQALQAIQQAGSAAAGLISSATGYTTSGATPSSWASEQTLIPGLPNWAILAGGGVFFMIIMLAGKRRR